MNRTTIYVGLIIIVILVAIGFSGSSEPASTAPPPATPAVMPNIESESDCGILQDIFDNAENAGIGAREEGDLGLAEAFTDAMRRADSRMELVGCYN